LRLAIRQLSKAYGFFWALKDISLDFRSGECVGLLGPNGAGKTTLLKLLAGLLNPNMGEIEIDEQKLGPGSSSLRAVIGFLSPHEHFYESLTARENLRFFGSLYGRRNYTEKIREVLDSVGLLRWADDYVAALSSGMRCRLAIAKWLLIEPRVLLLDEPYGVLDGKGVDLLESYLRKLCQNGGLVLMATHHVARTVEICSRAVILNQGRVIFDEPRQEPWENLQRAFEEFLPRGERWSF